MPLAPGAYSCGPMRAAVRFVSWLGSRHLAFRLKLHQCALDPREDAVSGSLVANLGVGPEIWLFLSLLLCLTLFFKFSRFWSVRNLDLLLLFALAPGMMVLVGHGDRQPQPWVFVCLFIGSALLLIRCFCDLGLSRRPLLEPNLNSAGLACLAFGVLGLLVAETVSLPVDEGAARNPAEPASKPGDGAHPTQAPSKLSAPVEKAIRSAPLPNSLRRKPPQVILSRVLASLAHLGLVAGLIVVGWKHFDRLIAGLAMATCYLVLPYTRIALVDSAQLVPAALIVTAVAVYTRPTLAGILIGMAGAWMPACLGLLPLWAGFYRGRGAIRFLTGGLPVVAICGLMAWRFPDIAAWAGALGARSLSEAGLLHTVEVPTTGSFWAGIDTSYRQPVLVLYLA